MQQQNSAKIRLKAQKSVQKDEFHSIVGTVRTQPLVAISVDYKKWTFEQLSLCVESKGEESVIFNEQTIHKREGYTRL